MARQREFDPDELLQVAIELFWQKGYCDASVDEVVRLSGVAKYGVYGIFGSKRELFKRALERYASDRHGDIQRSIRKPGAALPELRVFFKHATRRMTEGPCGCLMVRTGVELGLRDPELCGFVRTYFEDLAKALRDCLTRAIELNQMDGSVLVPALATYLATEFRTALMLAGSGSSRREIQHHLAIALTVLG